MNAVAYDSLVNKFLLLASSLPWHWILLVLHIVLATMATVHAMLYKRDPRAALGWVSVCLFFPLVGPVAYYMFGVNRIQTQARKLVNKRAFKIKVGFERGSIDTSEHDEPVQLSSTLERIMHASEHVTSRPLTSNNSLSLLHNGEQAYPAMLEAITKAQQEILLVTYLFDADATGEAFIRALMAAQKRGVRVHVIVDGVGEMYSWPCASRRLRRAGVKVARFLPPRLFPPALSINLRNHRKILVVDGQTGFTGGMNISDRHLVQLESVQRTVDLHFKLRGAIVSQLRDVFVEDWRFITAENLPLSSTELCDQGLAHCRCVTDGPNNDLDKITLILMAAISAATHNVCIITPYFLPSREMIASLQSAALRGVEVSIILPLKSNIRVVDWATRNLLWELLHHQVKVYYQPLPFAHTKLFIVDEQYVQVGSANLDPRSLRLNFELNLEMHGSPCIQELVDYFYAIRQQSTRVRLQDVDERSLLVRIRDSVCWLFMPYL